MSIETDGVFSRTPAECYVYRKWNTQVLHSSGVLCVNVPHTAPHEV